AARHRRHHRSGVPARSERASPGDIVEEPRQIRDVSRTRRALRTPKKASSIRRGRASARPRRTNMNASLSCIAIPTMLTVASVAAHHSPVLFDRNIKKTLAGTVVEFAWTNPHASIQMDVTNESGATERWGVEMGSPNSLVKSGWKSTILKAGDKITV